MAAFCGVGNPAGFRKTLEKLGYRVIAFREFADHYRYTKADVASLIAWTHRLNIAAVVCTSKDMVKLGIDRLGSRPLWSVTVAVNFLAGQEILERMLIESVSRRPVPGPGGAGRGGRLNCYWSEPAIEVSSARKTTPFSEQLLTVC